MGLAVIIIFYLAQKGKKSFERTMVPGELKRNKSESKHFYVKMGNSYQSHVFDQEKVFSLMRSDRSGPPILGGIQ